MFSIHIIDSGYIMADGGAMFGAIPKRYWQRKFAPDSNNQVQLVMRCLLLTSPHKRILIDLGIGEQASKRMTYYKPTKLLDLGSAIEQYGCRADEITDVILTHLHFDHCGGASQIDIELGRVLKYPNATYWVSNQQWNSMLCPNKLEVDSFAIDCVRPILNAGKLCLVDKDQTLCDGIELRLYDGHTQGQLVPFIHTTAGVVVFPGDVIPTSAHVPLTWISAYDISALETLKAKEQLLTEAAANNYRLIYCHDTHTISSKVRFLNDAFRATDMVIS